MIDKRLNYGRHLLRRFYPEKSGLTALDLGAGFGDDLLALRVKNPDARLIAVENFPEYVKLLQEKGIETQAIDIEKDAIPLPPGSVDVVICNQVLEHCKDIWWILHQISTVLKEGGHMIIGIPNLASLHNRLLLALGEQPTAIQNNSAHVRGYTKGDFLRFLDAGHPDGYLLRDFGGSNFYPFPPVIAKPLASLWAQAAWGIFFKLEKVKPYESGFLKFPVEKQLETRFYLG